jgi:hypothetical protein
MTTKELGKAFSEFTPPKGHEDTLLHEVDKYYDLDKVLEVALDEELYRGGKK